MAPEASCGNESNGTIAATALINGGEPGGHSTGVVCQSDDSNTGTELNGTRACAAASTVAAGSPCADCRLAPSPMKQGGRGTRQSGSVSGPGGPGLLMPEALMEGS